MKDDIGIYSEEVVDRREKMAEINTIKGDSLIVAEYTPGKSNACPSLPFCVGSDAAKKESREH